MGSDQIIDAIAARQYGVVARQQLVIVGANAIDRRIASGRLVPLYRGVYVVRGHDPAWPAPLMAACLATGGVASHRAAAHLHGLLDSACLEVTVPLSSAPVPAGVLVHRSTTTDVDRSDALPRTRVARTLIDLAAVDVDLAAEALDAALSRRLVTADFLRRRLEALGRKGRHGVRALDVLLADGRRRGQTAFERRLFQLLRQAGLPLPVPQYEVTKPDGHPAYLDFAYPDHWLAIEADSFRHHSGRADWARDRIRNRALTAMGWRILPATWEDLSPSTPLLGQIAQGLQALPRIAG